MDNQNMENVITGYRHFIMAAGVNNKPGPNALIRPSKRRMVKLSNGKRINEPNAAKRAKRRENRARMHMNIICDQVIDRFTKPKLYNPAPTSEYFEVKMNEYSDLLSLVSDDHDNSYAAKQKNYMMAIDKARLSREQSNNC